MLNIIVAVSTYIRRLVSHKHFLILIIQRFATDGLRTLLCGIKDLTEDDFQTWKAAHHEAAIALTDREDKLDFVYNEIEKNLQLVGATAIEDKLQVFKF